ncbi:hypothetical protein R9X47_11635 [Wukongibacter baidiensis]|uniref:hypothetical protein n=1 Tax=Wukongibacter baidiensis TaxID=1723361 RepID=UPI003D7FC4A6
MEGHNKKTLIFIVVLIAGIILFGHIYNNFYTPKQELTNISEMYLDYTFGYNDISKELFEYIKPNSDVHEIVLGIYYVFIKSGSVKSTISHTNIVNLEIDGDKALMDLSFRQTFTKTDDQLMMDYINKGTDFYIDRNLQLEFVHENDKWMFVNEKELKVEFSDSYELVK